MRFECQKIAISRAKARNAMIPMAVRLEKLRSPKVSCSPNGGLGAGGGGKSSGGLGGASGKLHESDTRIMSTPSMLKEKLGSAGSGLKANW